ncbi:MAG: histidinol dehydrogenase, partial [Candidatus Binatia bacterium]
MKIFRHPARETWAQILARSAFDTSRVEADARKILDDVKNRGDDALRNHTLRFDGVKVEDLAVGHDEFDQADRRIPAKLKDAIQIARSNIEKFHAAQHQVIEKIETTPGVFCWRKSVAIEKVG